MFVTKIFAPPIFMSSLRPCYSDHRCLCLDLSGRITTPDRFSYHTGIRAGFSFSSQMTDVAEYNTFYRKLTIHSGTYLIEIEILSTLKHRRQSWGLGGIRGR